MRATPWILLTTVVAAGGFALLAEARPPARARAAAPPVPNYDPSTEVTLTGVVTEVNREEHANGVGIHVIVNVYDGPKEVHLGPVVALEQLGLVLEPGDDVELTGSQVKRGDRTFVIAREVEKEDTRYVLRDAAGRPVWAKGRRERPGV